MSLMAVVRVFSQAPFPPTSEVELVLRARVHFRAELAFVVRHVLSGGARFEGTFVHEGISLAFGIDVRRTTEEDFREADLAEMRGKAGGMATLARRCGSVWVIDAGETSLEWVFLALLASVLLGPILPADGSTLCGVRGARLRAASFPAFSGERGVSPTR